MRRHARGIMLLQIRSRRKVGTHATGVVGYLGVGHLSLTREFTRGLTVTLEGTLGGLSNEFLPDLTRKFLHRDISGKRAPTTGP